jgi:hypothetical protein
LSLSLSLSASAQNSSKDLSKERAMDSKSRIAEKTAESQIEFNLDNLNILREITLHFNDSDGSFQRLWNSKFPDTPMATGLGAANEANIKFHDQKRVYKEQVLEKQMGRAIFAELALLESFEEKKSFLVNLKAQIAREKESLRAIELQTAQTSFELGLDSKGKKELNAVQAIFAKTRNQAWTAADFRRTINFYREYCLESKEPLRREVREGIVNVLVTKSELGEESFNQFIDQIQVLLNN